MRVSLKVAGNGKVLGVFLEGTTTECAETIERVAKYLSPFSLKEETVHGEFKGVLVKFKGDKDGAIAKASSGHFISEEE